MNAHPALAFYDLDKKERAKVAADMHNSILRDLESSSDHVLTAYFSDPDTYIRKCAYLALGRIWSNKEHDSDRIIAVLRELLGSHSFHVRQTAINAAGEIGRRDFGAVEKIFTIAISDEHHAPRNAVIGSIKKMTEVNPGPLLKWCKRYVTSRDAEIRRIICHGIELRGRKHPDEILPVLELFQDDRSARVRNTLVHVIGQIAYKEGCLEKVVKALRKWKNKDIVADAAAEIIDVHIRYSEFAALTPHEARSYIREHGGSHMKASLN